MGIRDADGELSSIDVLLADVAARVKAARAKRQAPKKAAAYRKRRATIEAVRQALGLPLAPARVSRIRPDSERRHLNPHSVEDPFRRQLRGVREERFGRRASTQVVRRALLAG